LFRNVVSQFDFTEEQRNMIAFGFEKFSQNEIGNPQDECGNEVKQHIKEIRWQRKKLDKTVGVNLEEHFRYKLRSNQD